MRSFVCHGDRYDEVMEEDVEPLMKVLQEDIARVHSVLEVQMPLY